MLPSWMITSNSNDFARSYSSLDKIERTLIDNAKDVKLLVEFDTPGLSYEYEMSALLEYGDEYFIVNTSGCSCPDPAETWDIMFHGPKPEVIDWLNRNGGPFRNAVAKLDGWGAVIPVEIKKGYDW